jgi:6-phosphogluconate dehydrogenase
MKDERVKAADMLGGPSTEFTDRYVDRYVDRSKVQSTDSPDQFVADVRDALYAAKIISYAQGFALLRDAATAYQWQLDYSIIARLWRGGCIIRSVFLADIQRAMQDDPTLENLVLAPFFTHALAQAQTGWRQVLVQAIALGIPMPAMSSALAYYDGYRSAVLPANLLQAQRDYFGAHTYERVDRPRGQAFHTDWLDAGKNKDRAGD